MAALVFAGLFFNASALAQADLMVYGPGGYKFMDFVKIGTAMIVIVGLIIINERHLVDRIRFEGSWTNFYTFFINGVAIVYE